MITAIEVPVQTQRPLELKVMYLVVRTDGHSKRFTFLGQKSQDDSAWAVSNHYPSGGEVLIPVDPWTAVKTHMCTFEELQLPDGARALLNIVK